MTGLRRRVGGPGCGEDRVGRVRGRVNSPGSGASESPLCYPSLVARAISPGCIPR